MLHCFQSCQLSSERTPGHVPCIFQWLSWEMSLNTFYGLFTMTEGSVRPSLLSITLLGMMALLDAFPTKHLLLVITRGTVFSPPLLVQKWLIRSASEPFHFLHRPHIWAFFRCVHWEHCLTHACLSVQWQMSPIVGLRTATGTLLTMLLYTLSSLSGECSTKFHVSAGRFPCTYRKPREQMQCEYRLSVSLV